MSGSSGITSTPDGVHHFKSRFLACAEAAPASSQRLRPCRRFGTHSPTGLGVWTSGTFRSEWWGVHAAGLCGELCSVVGAAHASVPPAATFEDGYSFLSHFD